MREIRTSGLMSGEGKRGSPAACHRAFPRLYPDRAPSTRVETRSALLWADTGPSARTSSAVYSAHACLQFGAAPDRALQRAVLPGESRLLGANLDRVRADRGWTPGS